MIFKLILRAVALASLCLIFIALVVIRFAYAQADSSGVADIVNAAHVSKTTFYEHFAGKEQVFIELHETCARARLETLRRAQHQTAGVSCWRERIRQIVGSYLEAIAGRPALILPMLAETSQGTQATRLARQNAVVRCSDAIIAISRELTAGAPEVQPLSRPLATAAVTGLLELTCQAAKEGPAAVMELLDPATELWIRLARASY